VLDGLADGGRPAPKPPPLPPHLAASDTLLAPPREPGLNAWRVTAVAGASAGAALVVMETQRRRWWEDRSPSFRVANDWGYVRWADKLGHFYVAALQTRGYRSTLRWAGLSEDQARLWGAIGGFTNQLYYEVLDGYGPQWGFSPGDLVFNTLGV